MSFIRDIMSQQVVTIRPDAKLTDAVRTLTEHDLSGAPVVTDKGQVVGFISEPALMDVLFDRDARCDQVSDRMTRDVHVVHPHEPLSVAARMFTMYGVRRLPVVDSGTLVGVVTRRDLLGHSLEHPEPLLEPLVDLIPSLAQFA
jgi:CBS domain-containing protein